MNLVKPTEPVIGRVVSNRNCMRGKSASFVRHIAIDVSGTPLEGTFHAGQAFGVVPPGTDEKGRAHKVRLYSIASPTSGEDGEGRILSTTCKRMIDEYQPQTPKDDQDRNDLVLGVCSNYLCDLKEGDEVLVTGPSGKRFILPAEPEAHDYLFLATGTGIAPFRGMLMDLFKGPDGPTQSQIHMVMGVGYTTDLLYDDEFRELAENHANFHYHTVISRPEVGRRMYVDQFIVETTDPFHRVLASDRTLLYICGIEGMQIGIYRLLQELGVAENYLKLPDEGLDLTAADAATIKRVKPAVRCMVEVY